MDADVIAAVDRRRELGESYNDTIRRLLGLPTAASRTEDLPDRPDWRDRNRLRALLDAELLHVGQTATWDRPRRRETHTATLDNAGPS
jgi:hypothetical protein